MAFLIDTINGSGLYAQSAASANVATHDSDGNVITATYLSSVDLTPYQTKAEMVDYQTVSGMTGYATTGDVANKLNTTAFSDVSGTFLTAHQSLDGYATTAWVDSQGYLTSHQPISADEWNGTYETVQTNSGSWGGTSIDTIPVFPISPLVTGFSGDSAYMAIESSALNLSSYVPVSALTIQNNYLQKISGYNISSYTGRYAQTANYSNTAGIAYNDRNGNSITSYYQQKLNIAGQDNTITAINGSAVGATIPSGFELVAGPNISIVDDDVNFTTTISADLSNYYTKSETSGATELANAFANIPGGNAEVNSYVQTNSGTIDETVETVQTNSASWGQGGGGSTILSGEVISGKFASSAGIITTHSAISSINSSGFGVLPLGTVLQDGFGGGLMQFGTTSRNPVFVTGGNRPSDNAWSTGNILILSGTQGQGYYKGHQLFLSTNGKAAITFDANSVTNTGNLATVKIYSYNNSAKYVGFTTSSIKMNDGSNSGEFTVDDFITWSGYGSDISYLSATIGDAESLLSQL